ncbi:MAG: hypothetical protein IPH18_01435 [Chitinophagaceae bacterium]|nr:hypothetical protein [Chitinophagaceae bacterium]MBK8952911.1 hypothetical protein [Chitinophagaceae bacterium]
MRIFWILLTVCSLSAAHAQTAEDSVRSAIAKLFHAMKNADTLLLKDCFTAKAILQTIRYNKEKMPEAVNENLHGFVTAVSKSHPGDVDERIVYEAIKTDDCLAVAWTPYLFYYKGEFSHCGVNSFQLVRINGEWKIQYLIDTRRREACSLCSH